MHDRLNDLALIRHAREVAILVLTGAREHERRCAVEVHFTRRDENVTRIGIVDVLFVVHVDATNGVDETDKSLEVDFGVMVDIDTTEFLHCGDRAARTAIGVGSIELLRARAWHLNHGVTRDRHHRDNVLRRVNTHEHNRVGTCAHIGIVLACV